MALAFGVASTRVAGSENAIAMALTSGPPNAMPRTRASSNQRRRAVISPQTTNSVALRYEKSSRSSIFRASVKLSAHHAFSPGFRGGLASWSFVLASLASN